MAVQPSEGWTAKESERGMTFNKWLDTLVEEKEIDTDQLFEVTGPTGDMNMIELNIVLSAIKNTSKREQAAIKTMLVWIDLRNGNIIDYFRRLAQALAI
jgi:hypothetical protein